MLNLHLNGDIVSCPDTRAIFARLSEQRLKQSRCKYNFEELKCEGWFNHCSEIDCVKPISAFGRCTLAGSDKCPMHLQRKTNGLKLKNYKIDQISYRKISSASHYLIKKSEYKLIFFTLTFPPFKKFLQPNEANKLFSQFIENLRRRHNCAGYIAVRETGTKFGRLHFHLLLSLPFVSFVDLNNYWCDIIREYCDFAPNALQTDPHRRFVNNPVAAMRYVCKYFSKTYGQKSESRLIFLSNNLLSRKEITYYDDIKKEFQYKRVSNVKRSFTDERNTLFTVNELFDKYQSLIITFKNDYTTGFKFAYESEFKDFCKQYLYNIFELPPGNNQLQTG